MPKTKISEYSTTNSANTDIESINIDEGCAPSGINNAIRELMVHLKEFQTGSSGDPLTVAGTFVASGGATLSGTNTLSGSTVMTASAGTSASPSIHFSSDTNTGIFSPAADTIAFAEGGAEAMRINSSGNLGIQVVPKAFNTVDGAAQVGTNFTITSFNNDSGVGYNHYYSSGWKYTNAGVASRFSSTSTIPFLWQYAASGSADGSITWSEAMRIDSSGNVGIGTTSPGHNLDIQATNPTIRVKAASTGYPYAIFTNDGGDFYFGRDSSAGGAFGKAYENVIWGVGARSTVFATNNTERARITSDGEFLVGTTSATGKVTISGIGGSNGNSLYISGWGSGVGAAATWKAVNTSNADVMYFETSGASVGKIAITSTATSYVTSSDYRLKHDIQPMTGALAKVAQLKPVTYKWNADDSDGEGFIAHELQEVAPYAVSGEKDGEQMQGVDYGKITPLLTAALQEAIAEIQSLKARVAELEAK
jgi:hypothetical protein